MNNGIKPLNTLLDTLSYITLLTNVPTAAYDFENAPSIKVCLADNNSTFVGFDSKEYKLTENDIVVKNKDKIICLGGILGDKNHGVSYSTTTAYIEFANFNFVNIRNTASKYNIRTDSAKRNSKKITNFSTMVAASMLQNYFSEIKYNIKIETEKFTPIKIDIEKINELIGSKLSKQDIMSHLKGLGFKFKSNNMVIPPLYRNDVVTNPDLAEEVIKSIDVNGIDEESIDISGMSEDKYTEYYFINKF
jgi:phenylalanyl-tRNA synthetase beta chain